MQTLARAIDRGLARLFVLAAWLILPIALCLFLQWPLRDVVQAYSRPANDAGQVLFAIYVAVAVAAATRAGAHLTPGNLAGRYPAWLRRTIAWVAVFLFVLPWAGFVLWSGWPMIVNSVAGLEHFQDTGNPGYFLIKLALDLLCAVIVAASLASLAPAADGDDRERR